MIPRTGCGLGRMGRKESKNMKKERQIDVRSMYEEAGKIDGKRVNEKIRNFGMGYYNHMRTNYYNCSTNLSIYIPVTRRKIFV